MQFLILFKNGFFFKLCLKNPQNGDTLGPVELIVWLEQVYQGDWREQDDQGEVSFIIFGMSKSSVFKNITYVAV